MPPEPELPSFFELDSLNVDVYDARAERDIAGTSGEGDVETLYSDFRRSPPAYGDEQVWVARRRG